MASAGQRSSMRARFEEVLGVHLMEFGIPEAMWHLRVQGFAGDRDDGCPRQ